MGGAKSNSLMPPAPGPDGVVYYWVGFFLATLSFIGVLPMDLRYLFFYREGERRSLQGSKDGGKVVTGEKLEMSTTGGNFLIFRKLSWNLAIPL